MKFQDEVLSLMPYALVALTGGAAREIALIINGKKFKWLIFLGTLFVAMFCGMFAAMILLGFFPKINSMGGYAISALAAIAGFEGLEKLRIKYLNTIDKTDIKL